MSLFSSIFTGTDSSASPLQLFLALLVSLSLGLALTWVYKYRTLYTKEFAVSLTLMPALMTLVIFFVNGNLGTSVAVAGTFSLIRFRSATSGSRELLALFLSMIIGLTAGMGYLLTAMVFTLFLLGLWLLLEKWQSQNNHQPRRHLTLTFSKGDGVEEVIEELLSELTREVDLLSISSLQSGRQLKLVYEISLKPAVTDFQLTNRLLSAVKEIDVTVTKQAKKRKNL